MSATIFYSENGELSLPEEPRRDGKKYKPVVPGEPLCVEIRRAALGNTKDWMGENEILASSWAKTGGDAKPAPRILNFYREKLRPYEAISNLGAEYFGHNLIYYSPAYNGEALRMTIEVLEVDQGGADVVKFVKSVSGGLTGLPFFAAQLPVLGALSLTPKIAEIGVGLYNMINKNDVLLKADLDLAFHRPHETPLNPGRYVFVYGTVAPGTFARKYRLNSANLLVESDGQDASRKGGLEVPYVVIQITSDPRKEYVRFEALSQQQEFLGTVISRLDDKYLQQLAGLLNPVAELASQGQLIANIARMKDEIETTANGDRKRLLTKMLDAEMAKVGDDTVQKVLRDALAGTATATTGKKGSRSKRATVKPPSKAEQIRLVIDQFPGSFSAAEIQAACPKVSLSYIRHMLDVLRKNGTVRCLSRGRSAKWVRA